MQGGGTLNSEFMEQEMDTDRIVSETFSSVDAAWLHMDTPTNLAIITGVMTFHRPAKRRTAAFGA